MIALSSQVLKKVRKEQRVEGKGKEEKKKMSFKITEKANTSTFLPSSDKSVATAEIRKLVNAFGNCRV